MGLSAAQRSRLYGAPGKVAKVNVRTPWGMTTQVHARLVGLFLDACNEAVATSGWRPRRCDGFAHRAIRGSSAVSLHSYALAWDFFATPPTMPPPGGVWSPINGLPSSFAAPFLRRGFTWGASWRRRDVPHIEWSQAPPSGAAAARVTTIREDDDVALTADEQRALAMIPAISMRVAQLQAELAPDAQGKPIEGGGIRAMISKMHHLMVHRQVIDVDDLARRVADKLR